MSMLRELYARHLDLPPGIVDLEGLGSLLTHPMDTYTAAGEFPARYFLAIQQALEAQGLGNVHRLPGLGNPAYGLTKTKSDVASPLHLLESGRYNPGVFRPLRGVASSGN